MSKKVTVYSKDGCMQCNFTKSFLEENDIPFESVNITQEPERADEVREMGFQTVPVIVIEGEKPFFGFRPELLESLVS